MKFSQVNINDYEAVIFVGGQGSKEYWENKTALNLAREANLKGKIIGAICSATGTIANAGLLKGKKATGWEDTKELVEKNNGVYTGNDIEISGRIVTAKGPKQALKFGEEIFKILKSMNHEE